MPQTEIDLDKILKANSVWDYFKSGKNHLMKDAMRELAKQILFLAAERAKIKYNDRDDCKQGAPNIDKESIISCINSLK